MKNWSLSQKVWMIVGILGTAFVISSTFAIFNAIRNRDMLVEVTKVLVKRDQLTAYIKDAQRTTTINLLETISRTDAASIAKFTKKYDEAAAEVAKQIAAYKEIAGPEDLVLAQKYEAELKEYLAISEKARALGLKNKNEEAMNMVASSDSIKDHMRALLDEMNELTAKKLEEDSHEAHKEATESIVLNLFLSTFSIFGSFLIAYFMLRSLSSSISQIVKGLSDGSIQVTTASAQIASASEELSQAANEQAASLEQTAASVEQMNSMIMKNTENANSTASLSRKSSSASEKGQAVVAKMIETMSHIDKSNAAIMEQVNESNEQIAGIVKVVEQIGKKTQVINDIVNKTELLSFNASVEAARAGEHGKGFAVVAEEVGNLARMSGAAAEEITSLIDGSIENVNKIVRETGSKVSTLIESGKRSVAEGTEVAHECGEVLREVVGNVNSVSAMSGEIATASTEQARGINEITKAMNQLDQMTQQNAATSEECASAAEELSAQAESLKNTVTLLVKTVNGSKAVTAGMSPDYEPEQKRLEPKSASAPKGNIVKLAARPLNPSKISEPVKKVSGDIPTYESDGFKDI
jgi:methyl-accepting chemotaxis protein